MLSRVADSIYWLNRYVERAENTARFIDANLTLILDSPVGVAHQWEPLVITTGDRQVFWDRYGEATKENVRHFLTFDAKNPNSILSCLWMARENARSIREVISSEMWQQINEFYYMVKETSPEGSMVELSDFYDEVKRCSHLFTGLMDATMSHNEGWHFGLIGRLLERADKTSRILDVKYFILLPSAQDVGTTLDEIHWIALLKSASAYEMYRKQIHRHQITPMGVAGFLLLDRHFPRAVRSCLFRSEQSLHRINGTAPATWSDPAERALGRLRSELEYITIEEIVKQGLHEFVDHLQQELNFVGEQLYQSYFCLESVC